MTFIILMLNISNQCEWDQYCRYPPRIHGSYTNFEDNNKKVTQMMWLQIPVQQTHNDKPKNGQPNTKNIPKIKDQLSLADRRFSKNNNNDGNK